MAEYFNVLLFTVMLTCVLFSQQMRCLIGVNLNYICLCFSLLRRLHRCYDNRLFCKLILLLLSFASSWPACIVFEMAKNTNCVDVGLYIFGLG